MKKTVCSLLVILVILGAGYVSSANVKITESSLVRNAFGKVFPNAKAVKWEEDKKDFIVFFQDNKVANYCRLDAMGNFLEKGVAYTASLPTVIEDAIVARYEDAEEVDKYRVTLSDKTTAYLVVVENFSEYIEILVKDDGTVIRERQLPSEEDDD